MAWSGTVGKAECDALVVAFALQPQLIAHEGQRDGQAIGRDAMLGPLHDMSEDFETGGGQRISGGRQRVWRYHWILIAVQQKDRWAADDLVLKPLRGQQAAGKPDHPATGSARRAATCSDIIVPWENPSRIIRSALSPSATSN